MSRFAIWAGEAPQPIDRIVTIPPGEDVAAQLGPGEAALAVAEEVTVTTHRIAAGAGGPEAEALAAPPAPTPSSLKAAEFWLYALSIEVTEADVIAAIDALETAQALTALNAERLRIKVRKASQFDRLDPDLLALAQAMGIAADQAALDAHFRSARGI